MTDYSNILVIAATEGELRGVPDGAQRLVCGVGPVDAGIATARALATATDTVAMVVHVGIAGSRSGGDVVIGDLVIGSAAVYCDTQSRFVEQRVEPDGGLLAATRAAFPDAHVRAIGTSADVAGTKHRTDIAVEAMEGFAVLRAAGLAGVPAIEVRVVANEIDEPDRAKWQFDRALDVLAEMLPRLLTAVLR